MNKKKIYISGKISGQVPFARAQFKFAADAVEKAGFEAVNPFDNGLDEDDTWEKHLAVDIINLMGCDAILQLPGWEASRGARLEWEVARQIDLPVATLEGETVKADFPPTEIYKDLGDGNAVTANELAYIESVSPGCPRRQDEANSLHAFDLSNLGRNQCDAVVHLLNARCTARGEKPSWYLGDEDEEYVYVY